MKVSQYNIIKQNESHLVIYNTKTARMVRFSDKKQIADIKKVFENQESIELLDSKVLDGLYKAEFIVDDSRDEYNEFLKTVIKRDKTYSRLFYGILYITENCNFRCKYCFEEHIDKKFSPELWNALYLHIKKSLEKNLYDRVSFNLFGGEPLLELNNLLLFLQNMYDLSTNYPHVPFKYNLITNGYLLTPEIYDKLVSLGVKLFQITVDGFEEHHNKQRPLINGGGTWNRIIENLKYINSKNDDAEIIFRTNVDNEMMDCIDSFKEWAYENFNNKKIKFVFHPVVKFSEHVKDSLLLTGDDNYNKLSMFDIDDNRAFHNNEYCINRYNVCPAVYERLFGILPDGSLIKCEDHKQSEDNIIVGKLNLDGDLELNEYIDLFTKDMETENCCTCKVYPICCARSCPYAKAFSVIHNTDRFDCERLNYLQCIESFLEQKLLNNPQDFVSNK